MSLKIELLYDPHDTIPLKLNIPTGLNPNLIICLLSQVITGLSQEAVGGSGVLVVPGHALAKVNKTS